MKIVRLSLIISFLRSAKNIKQYLLYINIGLFLSIFALSAAVISFVIETRIDKTEFETAEFHKEARSYKKIVQESYNMQHLITLMINNEKNLIDLYEYIGSTKMGDHTITVNDLYLPSVYIDSTAKDSKLILDMIKDGSFDQLIEFFKDYKIDDQDLKDFKKSYENIKKLSYLFEKDFSEYYDKIFNYKSIDLVNEVRDKKSINYYNDPIYEDHLNLQKLYDDIIIVIRFMTKYFEYLSLGYEDLISENNRKIVNLSNLESKIIISAFFLQFIIFVIIQYFEISSLRKEQKSNATRKT
tara:strand:+ start:214 stop:1107 length:894 start_codon:yes stop_codon:yes gene_type:complete